MADRHYRINNNNTITSVDMALHLSIVIQIQTRFEVHALVDRAFY